MKLTTIWTLCGLDLRERLQRTEDALWCKLAARLPKKLAYWTYITMGVRHIQSDEIVPDVPYTTILGRLPR